MISFSASRNFGKQRRRNHIHFSQAVQQRHFQAPQPIGDAAEEVDGGRFVKIPGGATDFSDGVAIPDDLRQNLVVENEVVGIFFQGQFL